MGLPVASRRLNISGVADVVEFHRETDRERPFPVEYKRGKPKLHRADEVQLCAQALCLEEMTDAPVLAGALFYTETKRRVQVPSDAGLRALTEATVADLARVFAAGETPPPTLHTSRCRACSLHDLCCPETAGRRVVAWRDWMVTEALDDRA